MKSKRERDYDGVYSNGKKTFDLHNLNTKAEMEVIDACFRSSSPSGDDLYYATPNGTVVHSYTYYDLDDWFADLGAIYNKHRGYEVLGRKFTKIRDQGEPDEDWVRFNEWCEQCRREEREETYKNEQGN